MKTELAGIFYCNFYLGKACQLAYAITSLKAIRTNKIETKFHFNPYHHSLRLILRHLVIPNKHVLPDLRLTLTHLVLLLLFLHDRCIQHHGLSNINLTSWEMKMNPFTVILY